MRRMNKRGADENTSPAGMAVGLIILLALVILGIFAITNNWAGLGTIFGYASGDSVDTFRTRCNQAAIGEGNLFQQSKYCTIRTVEFPDKKVLKGNCLTLADQIQNIEKKECPTPLTKCENFPAGEWATKCNSTKPKDFTTKVEDSRGHDIRKEKCCGASAGCGGEIIPCENRNENNCELDGKCNARYPTSMDGTVNSGADMESCIQVTSTETLSCSNLEKGICLDAVNCKWTEVATR